MDSAVYAPYRYSRRARAGSRLRWALAVSVFSHLLFAAALVSEAPHRRAQIVGAAPILVRLEPMPRVPPAGPAVADVEEFPIPRRVDQRPASSVGVKPAARLPEVSAIKPKLATPPALPQIPDPTVYTARDLDSYPRPVVSLDFGRLLELSVETPHAEVRFELLIDEHGIVNDVTPAGPEAARLPGAKVRAALAATRFIPARKDGRAVKSRMLVSISYKDRDR